MDPEQLKHMAPHMAGVSSEQLKMVSRWTMKTVTTPQHRRNTAATPPLHRRYTAATPRVYGGYMAATWRLHGGCSALAWPLRGR